MSKSSILIIISVAALSMLYTVVSERAFAQMKKHVEAMYKSRGGFEKVIDYWKRQHKYYKPLVMLVLFEHMRDLGDIEDVMKAITVYEMVMQSFTPKTTVKYTDRLVTARTTLVNDILIPSAANALEVGDSSKVSKVIDWMKNDTRGIADKIVSLYWDSVRDRAETPVGGFARTSKEPTQNLYLVSTLYKMHKEGGRHDDALIHEMRLLSRSQELPLVDARSAKNIKCIYADRVDNYNKAIDFIENLPDAGAKAEHLTALYRLMYKLDHVNDVLLAISLHDQISLLLHADFMSLSITTLLKLGAMNERLYKDKILQQSVAMLVNKNSQARLTKLIDLVHNSTDDLADEVIGGYWDKIVEKNEVDPVWHTGELTPYVRQNVFLLLVLHRTKKINDDRIKVLRAVLRKIMLNPDYRRTVSREHKRLAERIYSFFT